MGVGGGRGNFEREGRAEEGSDVFWENSRTDLCPVLHSPAHTRGRIYIYIY